MELGKESQKARLTRRSFLKATAATAGTAALAGGATTGLRSLAIASEDETAPEEERVVTTICRSNCFQACLLKAHVRDGKIRSMSPADYPEEIYTGCCLKGLSIPERVYSPTRVQYPMRRVGERGGDQWERITWEEALDEIADTMKAIREEYGPQAIAFDAGSGNYGMVQGTPGLQLRFCNALELTRTNISYDQAFGYGANRVIGGGVWGYSNETKTMLDSKHILIWGANPVNTQPQTWRIVRRAQEQGAHVTCIDPIYSATAARCDEHMPIKPGTDLYVALAILNRIVSNDAIDREYAAQYTTAPFLVRKDNGFMLRSSHLQGNGTEGESDFAALNKAGSMANDPAYVWDEVADEPVLYTECKTPALEGTYTVEGIEVQTVYTALKDHVKQYTVGKAAEISEMREEDIIRLSDIYASEGPVFLYSIYAIDHYRNGHLWAQAMSMIAALTNNISRPGSSIGGFGAVAGDVMIPLTHLNLAYVLTGKGMYYPNIPACELANVIGSGKHKGQDYPIKMLMLASSNAMSNFAEQNKWVNDVLPNLDMVVTLDSEMSDTARYSDIVLPVAFWLEGTDVRCNFSNPYVAYGEKAIEPLYESKLDSEIYALLAEKLGLGELVPLKEPEEWIDILLDSKVLKSLGVTHRELKEKKAVRIAGSKETPQIRGYGGAPFPTPSGRAHLYCEAPLPRVDFGQDWQTPAMEERFPSFRPPEEAWDDSEAAKKYPLNFVQTHERWRVHSQWYGTETMRELDPEPYVYLSRNDADARGIHDGDLVEVFNDRGHMVAKALVNDGCRDGIAYTPKGWQKNQYVEGCYQELTSAANDPMAVNFAYYDNRVEIKLKG